MPIYEYRCPKCGTFETMQRITEAPLKRCPTCKSKVERMMSRTSFVLKGTGWYATDYARSGSGKSPDSSSDKSSDKSAAASTGNGSSTNESSAAPSSDGGSDKSSSTKTTSSASEKSTGSKSSD